MSDRPVIGEEVRCTLMMLCIKLVTRAERELKPDRFRSVNVQGVHESGCSTP